MSDDKFALVRNLVESHGYLIRRNEVHNYDWICPKDLQDILEKAPVVYSNHQEHVWTKHREPVDLVSGRVVCIDPIIRDSADSLLKEILNGLRQYTVCAVEGGGSTVFIKQDIINRAHALFEKEGAK